MALENSPVDARGLMSGVLQQGYSFGYVCAACAVLGIGDSADSWKAVFWVAAGLSIGVGILRCFFPDSQQFIEARKAGKNKAHPSQFWKETKIMLGQEWKMCIYCIILMTWFNCKDSVGFQLPCSMLTISSRLQPYFAGQLYNLHAHRKRAAQRCRNPR